MKRAWTVLAPAGYPDRDETAELVEVVEGCLIFSDPEGATAIYSPDTWRMVVRKSDGMAVA